MKYFDRFVRVVFNDGNNTEYVIEDVSIQFQVDKSTRATPSKGTIRIYNLSKDTVSLLSNSQKTATVSIFAGYKGLGPTETSIGMIFQGNPTKILTEVQGVDKVTTIECGDGQRAMQQAKISKSFSKNSSATEIIGALAGAILKETGIANVDAATQKVKDRVTSLKIKNIWPRGVVLSGQASVELSLFCNSLGLEWYIEEGGIVINEINKSGPYTVLHLSPESGLIGSPSFADKGRIEVKALLLHEAKPGMSVSIESDQHNGTYKIHRIQHGGSNRVDSEFYTELECSILK